MEIHLTSINKLFGLGGLLVLLTAPLNPAYAVYDGPEPIEFTILMEGDTVGFDRVEFKDHGDTLEVTREIEITVTFLIFNAYEYTHTDREIWKDGVLQSLESQTNDNGEQFTVNARRTDQGLKVNTGDSTYLTSSEIIPTSYWNRELVEQDRLLDTQHGGILEVRTRQTREERINIGSQVLSTTKYQVDGELELEVWYDRLDRWSRLAFEQNGYQFIYRLNPRTN